MLRVAFCPRQEYPLRTLVSAPGQLQVVHMIWYGYVHFCLVCPWMGFADGGMFVGVDDEDEDDEEW